MVAPDVAGGHAASPLRAWFDVRAWAWPQLVGFALGVLPSVVFFLWYNAVRFGSPLESGYGLATLLGPLAERRELGLFSFAHLGTNIDYLLLRLPQRTPEFPWLKPDGYGMSILLTSPGLLLAARADWRSSRTVALGLTALAVLVPSLLYYGGGFFQYGYRYAQDSIPFVIALCGLAAARHGVSWLWRVLILFGVVVGLAGVYWAYNG